VCARASRPFLLEPPGPFLVPTSAERATRRKRTRKALEAKKRVSSLFPISPLGPASRGPSCARARASFEEGAKKGGGGAAKLRARSPPPARRQKTPAHPPPPPTPTLKIAHSITPPVPRTKPSATLPTLLPPIFLRCPYLGSAEGCGLVNTDAMDTALDAVREPLRVVETKLEAVRAELDSSSGGGAAAPGLLATAVKEAYPGGGAECTGLTVTPSDTSIQFSCDNAGGIEGRCPAGYAAVGAVCELSKGPNTWWGGRESRRFVPEVLKCNTNISPQDYTRHKMQFWCVRVSA
jgi:hypothetical protein